MTYGTILLSALCAQTPTLHPAHHGGIPAVAYTSADSEAAALALAVSTLALPAPHAAPRGDEYNGHKVRSVPPAFGPAFATESWQCDRCWSRTPDLNWFRRTVCKGYPDEVIFGRGDTPATGAATVPPAAPVAPAAVYSQPWGYGFPVASVPVWRPVPAWGGGGWFRGGPVRCTPRG